MDMETAILAGGCFWCTEAIFNKLKGVESVIPGYTGGNIANPSYEQVSSGTTNHAEAVLINFNPNVISFGKLLEIFFKLHDPTTLNRQGTDVGTQYRSAIFYHDKIQKQEAEQTIKKVKEAVTKLEAVTKFYPAEDYHKNYYEKNSSQPYCRIVIDPKIQKLYKEFEEDVREN